jgi:hypothetical protein
MDSIRVANANSSGVKSEELMIGRHTLALLSARRRPFPASRATAEVPMPAPRLQWLQGKKGPSCFQQ